MECHKGLLFCHTFGGSPNFGLEQTSSWAVQTSYSANFWMLVCVLNKFFGRCWKKSYETVSLNGGTPQNAHF